jgi:hypothetical protein
MATVRKEYSDQYLIYHDHGLGLTRPAVYIPSFVSVYIRYPNHHPCSFTEQQRILAEAVIASSLQKP